MLKFAQDITVDLNVELTNNVLNSIHVNQYEHKSREINIYVKKDGIDYPIPNNLTVNIRIHKSNGYDIYKTIGKDIGAINGNIITIIVDESMTIAHGRQTCDIEFIDSNNNRLYSTKFYINVHKSALDDNNIKDNDDYSTVQSLARESKEYANLSESYAVGTNNEIRENDSIDNAKYYKEQSEIAKNIAVSKAEEASVSESNAKESENNAANSANIATTKANEASTSATNSENYAKQSQSYAVGAGNVRPNEASDNAKYYYEQAKSISESFSGTLRPKGTIGFSLFANTVMNTASEGDMYNISDEFVTSPIFKEGEGHWIPAGANIYKTTDGMWDVLAGSPVTSVNGMRGNVNITAAGIGALPNTTKYAGSDSVCGAATKAANIVDAGDGRNITIAYSKSGLDSVVWLAGWNGNELRAVSPDIIKSGGSKSLDYFLTTSTTNLGLDPNVNCIGYVSGTSSILGQNDGSLITQRYSDAWKAQIYTDYRTGQIATRGKNNGSWGAWRKVLDHINCMNYSTPGKQISNQVFNWATSIGWIRLTSAIRYTESPFIIGFSKGYNYSNTNSFYVLICPGYGTNPPRITQLSCKLNSIIIDAVRCVYNNDNMYVEIHTSSTSLNTEYLKFTLIGLNNNYLQLASSYTTTIESGYKTADLFLNDDVAIKSNALYDVETCTNAEHADFAFESDTTQKLSANSCVLSITSSGQLNYDISAKTYTFPMMQVTTKNINYYPIMTTDSPKVEYYSNVVNTIYEHNYSDGRWLCVNTANGTKTLTYSTSDTRLKTNINPTKVNDALEKINSIQCIEFDWKDTLGHVNLGISANELQEIIAEAVIETPQPKESEYDTIKEINTPVLLNYCIKAIQELSNKDKKSKERLDNLETKYQELIEENKELHARIEMLENINTF
ncbi:MAG: BppU family phage baseplate upper protein [Lachnospira sp.]|nr:BppU family phage baseplate upper protein [Lachnospira sp.]